jgi:CRISPR system Cascade subunit CasD
MGRRRDQSLDDLQKIIYGVRIDQPGVLVKDFHTAHTSNGRQAFVSDRYYLSDAVFLVGLESDDDLLNRIDQAIQNPAFPLFLGRRSCPPANRISLGIREDRGLLEALHDEPWLAGEWYQRKAGANRDLEIVCDAAFGVPGTYSLRDIPISFDQGYRKYRFREISRQTKAVQLPNMVEEQSKERETDHDPMRELEVG